MKSKLVLLIALILALGGCGNESEPGNRSKAVDEKEVPDSLAQGAIDAFARLDCAAIAKRSRGRLADFYGSLKEMGAMLGNVADELTKLYPQEKDAPSLAKLRHAWQKPVTRFKGLRIDGYLKSATPDHLRRYRISWTGEGGQRQEDVMVVAKVDGAWLMESLGQETPSDAMVGNLKTQLNLLEFSYTDALETVKKQKPATLAEAIELFSKTRIDLVEGR